MLEYDGSSGAIQRWYAYGLGANDVLNQTNVAAATRTALIPDIQGSIIATLDSTTATLTKAGYLPYGESANAPVTFGYTAQRIDPETNGLYYYRARHYSPVLGRFLQTDPSGTKGGINLYAYAKNDPLNLVDTTGRTADAPSSGVAPASNFNFSEVDITDEEEQSGTSTITQNAANGRAFEQQGLNYLQGSTNDVAAQVSVRPFTASGALADYRVRLDALSTSDTGNMQLYDFKSSATAGFTVNQQSGYPLLQQFGGQVVGNNGGLSYPGGTVIPPTPVTIFRLGDF